MGDDRDGPMGRSSGRGWTSVTTGWADPLRTETDFEYAQAGLIEYLTRTAHLTEAESREIVTAAVTRFRAAWHAGASVRRRHGQSPVGPSPKELAAAVYNDVLDLRGADPLGSHEVDMRGPREKDDEWLAVRATGAQPDAVRIGLAQLVAAQKRIDFLIITHYLDLVDRDRTRPPRAAQVVAGLDGEVASEEVVRQAIRSFQERMKRMKEADG